MSKEMLLQSGLGFYRFAKDVAGSEDDQLILDTLRANLSKEAAKHAEVVNLGGDKTGFSLPAQFAGPLMGLQSAEGELSAIGLIRWVHAGFPSVQMGHRYAAALLTTNATAEAIDMARPPFTAFMIELPDGLLCIENPSTKEPEPLRRILVSRIQSARLPDGWAWAYTAYTETGITIYRFGVSGQELLPPTIDEDILPDGRQKIRDPLDFEVTKADERVMGLVGKLIVNTCLAMSDPTQVREIGRSHEAWKKRQSRPSSSGNVRDFPEPVVRVFQVGKPVKHDFREVVREYVAGARKSTSVQVLVAGHYKMQPHGPRNSLRKLIWREPFWRGPDDAPIPVRPHVLDDEDE